MKMSERREILEKLRKMQLPVDMWDMHFKDFRIVNANLFPAVSKEITENLEFAPNLDTIYINDDFNNFATFVLCDDGNWRTILPKQVG
jgi:hypothetical protein